MVSLTDIAPAQQEVHGITVYGISAEQIVYLIRRFPALGKLSLGTGIKVSEVLELGPQIVSAIIAVGGGYSFERDATLFNSAENIASKLGIEVQADLIEAVVALTFPSGLGPFVERISQLADNASASVLKARDTKSQHQSKRSPRGSELNTVGDAPPVN